MRTPRAPRSTQSRAVLVLPMHVDLRLDVPAAMLITIAHTADPGARYLRKYLTFLSAFLGFVVQAPPAGHSGLGHHTSECAAMVKRLLGLGWYRSEGERRTCARWFPVPRATVESQLSACAIIGGSAGAEPRSLVTTVARLEKDGQQRAARAVASPAVPSVAPLTTAAPRHKSMRAAHSRIHRITAGCGGVRARRRRRRQHQLASRQLTPRGRAPSGPAAPASPLRSSRQGPRATRASSAARTGPSPAACR